MVMFVTGSRAGMHCSSIGGTCTAVARSMVPTVSRSVPEVFLADHMTSTRCSLQKDQGHVILDGGCCKRF